MDSKYTKEVLIKELEDADKNLQVINIRYLFHQNKYALDSSAENGRAFAQITKTKADQFEYVSFLKSKVEDYDKEKVSTSTETNVEENHESKTITTE
jgi:hypothetical protein